MKARETLAPEASKFTFAVNGYDPATGVNPEIDPLEATNRKPEAKQPLDRVHW